ncbi:MAG TPA: GGDEF domain-containing protein, partial [Burkholderiaceae bacterium]|nr:GGDEF domain-containing protein [Burkholderiaceae bacterium]
TLQALALFEERNDLRQAADCFNALSDITEAKGEYKAALGWLRRASDAFTRFASASARAHAAAMEVREGAERARALAASHLARAERLERSNEELAREAERLARTSLEDALTGIANRRALDQRLSALFSDRRGRARCSLALLDIDRFKWVNDTFLHTTGDKVLVRLGAILRECSREKDVVARFGGEEFAVVFVDIDPAEVDGACERMRQAVEGTPWAELHTDLAVTVSIGYGHFDEGGESVEELVKVADARLFQAKRAGRNRVAGPQQTGSRST